MRFGAIFLLNLFSTLPGSWAQQPIFQCPICGDDREITNMDAVVTVSPIGDFPCSTLQQMSRQGAIDSANCVIVQNNIGPCGCQGESGTSETPAEAPGFDGQSACFKSINRILTMEFDLSVEDLGIGRTYILCPNTDFVMARLDIASNTFVDGNANIRPRPNVHIQCGDSGSSANKCRLLGGSFPILQGFSSADPEQFNVTFQGLTIEAAERAAVYAGGPGDMTFVDCVFKNHKNIGPVHVPFGDTQRRSLADAKIAWPQQARKTEGTKDMVPYHIGGDHRSLQGSESSDSLTLTFKNCVFEDNELAGQGANSGLVTAVSEGTTLIFEDVVFRNNDYGNSALKASTSAIFTKGPLTLTNTCFIGNSFVRDARVVSIHKERVDARSNYVDTEDDGLACSLVARYANESAWEKGILEECILPDLTTCQSTTTPTSPQETSTRAPVPQVTRAPIPPTQDSGSISLNLKVASWTLISITLVFICFETLVIL